MEENITSILAQVKALVGQNKKAEALLILENALVQYPDIPLLMLWYAGLTSDLEKGVQVLERVLQLEPGNLAAQKGLEDLRRKLEASSPVTPPEQGEQISSNAKPSVEPLPSEQNQDSASEPDLVEVAGQTIWTFRNLNRPIQELVNDGLVTTKDLAWAAQNANNARLRWAAAVYLRRDQIRGSRPDMDTLKSIIWPFRGINRPILEVVQKQQITIKDLVYAILNAKEITLIQGAAVAGYLLLMGEIPLPAPKTSSDKAPSTPKPSSEKVPPAPKPAEKATPPESKQAAKGPLIVVKGSPYLDQRQNALGKNIRLFKIAGTALTVLSLALLCAGMFISAWLWWALIPSVIAYALVKVLEKLQQEEENLSQGMQGEKDFVAELSKHLNEDWVLFRNIDLPDHGGDLDAVLVGPKGIYLLEIKAYNFTCRNQGDRWEYRAWLRWKPLSKNPTQQALRNAARLNEYLKQILEQDAWIEPRIVWAGKSKLFLDKPRVKVWYLHHSEYWLKEIHNGRVLPMEKRSQIVGSLRALCAVNRNQTMQK